MKTSTQSRGYNGPYRGEYLNKTAFPLGGIGAGMVCMEGTGTLSHVSLRHEPEVFNEPLAFSALHVRGIENGTRVLEGPVPSWKVFFPWQQNQRGSSGNGGGGSSYGLPRFADAEFLPRFPFATVSLKDPNIPVDVMATGWSPFIPGNSHDSSLPVAAVEYIFRNSSDRPIECVYSFNTRNFLTGGSGGDEVTNGTKGFILRQAGTKDSPHSQGAFYAMAAADEVKVNCRWFRSGWFDALTILWKELGEGRIPENPPVGSDEPSPGGSLMVEFTLDPGQEKNIPLLLSWYVPYSDLRVGKGLDDIAAEENAKQSEGAEDTGGGSCCCTDGSQGVENCYRPWYSSRFKNVEDVGAYWSGKYDLLKAESAFFRDTFFDTTLPPEVVEAVAANMTILKSPTVLRQYDGRLWCWEGCCDSRGCCPGSCTHVWNYAQALGHLFPDLERSLRTTEFGECQNAEGRQTFRAPLPIRQAFLTMLPAADGQLGGMMKVYREWRISGDTEWLRSIWPKVKASMDFCIEQWDPDRTGLLSEPQHNTYDIEFWGPNGICSSFYLGALQASAEMAEAIEGKASKSSAEYRRLYTEGKKRFEEELWDGEYFIQKVQWEGLRAGDPRRAESLGRTTYSAPEAAELLQREGPKYQYGSGCLSDGVLGDWIARTSGLDGVIDPAKIASHLQSVYRYNFKDDLTLHANPQRPNYALGSEAGLLLCSWPKGGQPSLPFVYSNEVWTGIEYQVASHLMMLGEVEMGLDIVRACRDRYDGRIRNPFNEYECGHWYARAMASYGLIQGLTGIRYDAVTETLYIEPKIAGDFTSFLSTATGFGTAGVQDGKPFVEVRSGRIETKKIEYRACG